MFRKVAGFGAAAAGAATPSSSQCYSRPSARPAHTVDLKGADDWQLVFGQEEVRETVAQVLGYPPKAAQDTSTVVIEEDGSPDTTDSGSESASTYLMQADNRIVSQDKLQESFGNSLLTLLNDRGVQHACMRALSQDPSFSEMLTQLEAGAPLRNAQSMPSLLPPAVQTAETQQEAGALEANIEESLKAFLDGLGERVQVLGNNIKGAWDSAGAAVGGTVMRIGYAIRSLLGKKFNTGSSQEFQWDGNSQAESQERVGKVMMQVAMAVMALLIFKRVCL